MAVKPVQEVIIPEETGEEIPAVPQKPAEDRDAALRKRRRRRVRAFRSLVLRTIGLVLVVYILFFHIVGLTMMPGKDMYPRLDVGDLLLFYRIDRTPKFQDVIVIDKQLTEDTRTGEKDFVRKALDWLGFKDPEAPETKRYVCRVVGAPGDTVDISMQYGLRLNGNVQIESNIFYPTQPYEEGVTEYPVELGEGEYFVLVDQRNGGMDSRYFGIVKQDEIQGIVITILRRNNL